MNFLISEKDFLQLPSVLKAQYLFSLRVLLTLLDNYKKDAKN